MTLTLNQLLKQAKTQLPGEAARLEAELLLAHVLNKPRAYLYTWPEKTLESHQVNAFTDLVNQRQQGTPIAYLTSQREFWSLPLSVNPSVLIPRPDTERLVEVALSLLPDTACNIADLGTGSGAIALALASERPDCQLFATDISESALETAAQNARTLNINNITFSHGHWFEALPAMNFDMIVSNPPYIAAQDPHLQQGDVRFEPDIALISGEDGLNDIRTLIHQAKNHLTPGKYLLLEHGYQQGEATRALFKAANYHQIQTDHDQSGQPRVTLGHTVLTNLY